MSLTCLHLWARDPVWHHQVSVREAHRGEGGSGFLGVRNEKDTSVRPELPRGLVCRAWIIYYC